MNRATALVGLGAVLGLACGEDTAVPIVREHAGHEASPAPVSEHAGRDAHGWRPGATPPGRAPVVLDEARRQALGVRTAPVGRRSFTREVRATGIVRVDERRQSHVHVKFEGFVERVFVNFVGRQVRAGERLLSVYSPELYAAESELAQALAELDRPRSGPFAASDRAQSRALADAARQRLRLLDVPPSELARLERTREPRRALTLVAPISGTVLERDVVDGMRVMPDTTLMVIADLSRVWVVADVFENDVGALRLTDHAQIRFRGGAAPDRQGRVAFISPVLDESTRTAKVRIELENLDGAVRPGLFAEVAMHVEAGERLAVPEAAVVSTGIRDVVFVQTGPGRYEPRVVRTGARAEGFAEVVEGVAEGQTVAVSAQFLLDAESQIRGGPGGGAHGGH